MTRINKPLDDDLLMRKLKNVLLKEDREQLMQLKEVLDDPNQLSEKVNPLIEQRLDFLKKNFPKEYRLVVNQIVEERLRGFQDEVLNIMYPVLGKMIRKYITHQFQLMKDRIDTTVRSTFSIEALKRKLKSVFLGVNESDLVMSQIDGPVIEEIYVIQRNSGLLLGSASLNNTIDQDVIAGMLTAIKSFVEDAFQRESEDLERIQYGSYKIFIQNYHSYYIAVVMSGSLSAKESDALSTRLSNFTDKELTQISNIDNEAIQHISSKLNEYFVQPQRNN